MPKYKTCIIIWMGDNLFYTPSFVDQCFLPRAFLPSLNRADSVSAGSISIFLSCSWIIEWDLFSPSCYILQNKW